MFYVFRFFLVWFVVVFIGERYIGVCYLLRRRDICIKSGMWWIVGFIFVIFIVIVFYKLIFSVIYVGIDGKYYCMIDRDYDFVFFVLDSIYVVFIMLVLFVIIMVLNILIMWRLIICNKCKRECKIIIEESIIWFEFIIILLVILFCFIGLNILFFVVWFWNFFYLKFILKMDVIEYLESYKVFFNFEFW